MPMLSISAANNRAKEVAINLTQKLCGLTLLTIGVSLLLSFITYSPHDPSLNTAVGEGYQIQNMLGVSGAYTSDFLLQSLGLAAYIASLVTLGWGWRLLHNRAVRRIHFRITSLLIGLVAVTLILSKIPAFSGWISGHGRLGGLLGILWQEVLPSAAFGQLLIYVFVALLSVVTLFYATAYSLAEWTGWMAGAARLVLSLGIAMYALVHGAFNVVKNLIVGEKASAKVLPVIADVAIQTDKREEGAEEDALPPFLKERKSRRKERAKSSAQSRMNLDGEEFEFPTPELLQMPKSAGRTEISEETLRQNANMLSSVLTDFSVSGDIVKVHPGPVVTLYELEPAPGTKSSRVIGLSDDIARSMSAISARVAVVPGRNAIGIELPNPKREMVYMREMLTTEAYTRSQAKLPLILGKDIGGAPVVVDLARMPHLLVAGTTGSGKSVAINTMIMSLVYKLPPEKCRFIMVDPKMLELSVYEGIPHLLTSVVTEPRKAVVALKWTVREMENRYRAMSQLGVRNVDGYNERIQEAKKNGEIITKRIQTGFDPDTGKPIIEEQPLPLVEFPYIVVIVDEMADLMLVAGKDIEAAIQRLAQMARAAGIHLIMATQRPSVDVITGTIKANFPTRVSFQVTSKIDSRTILGEQGAEQLLGQGDMLYMAGGGRITRVHGPFVSDNDVESVAKFLRTQGEANYIEDVTEEEDEGGEGALGDGSAAAGSSGDEMYDKAVAIVCSERKASISYIQRHLRIGYNTAARLIERMESEGVVSKADHVGRREVLAPKGEYVG